MNKTITLRQGAKLVSSRWETITTPEALFEAFPARYSGMPTKAGRAFARSDFRQIKPQLDKLQERQLEIDFSAAANIVSFPAIAQTPTRFEPGQSYYTRSIGDHNCIFSVKVTARTPKTITAIFEGQQKRYRPWISDGVEKIHPAGRYSMAPTIDATNTKPLKRDWES